MLPGVFATNKKNGQIYYRASISYNGKHISLGSYETAALANQAYLLAGEILEEKSSHNIEGYPKDCILSFEKWVVLINFKDNKIYFKNPIFLKKRFFFYYLDSETCLKFDIEDLFYYAHHKIMKRGGHLFVSDYGMQVNIMSRYGIKNYAVPGKDFYFLNGDDRDFSYHNIEIVNSYYGVSMVTQNGNTLYQAKIHIKGNYLIGRYPSETEAAIAYNKAALILNNHGADKNYPQNFIEGINEITYASLFQKVRISKKIISYAEGLSKAD